MGGGQGVSDSSYACTGGRGVRAGQIGRSNLHFYELLEIDLRGCTGQMLDISFLVTLLLALESC